MPIFVWNMKGILLKRKILNAGIVLSTLILCSGWFMHKFYVSLTEVRYNIKTERFEISMRIFPDDLDQVLLARNGIHSQLASKMEHEEADSLLRVYLLKSFAIHADGEEISISYLGKEPESDAIWCYLESSPVKSPQSLSIRNEVLTEIFPEQVNIVQVYIDKWNKGLLLNLNQTIGKLTID
jgi:hypothetical protein